MLGKDTEYRSHTEIIALHENKIGGGSKCRYQMYQLGMVGFKCLMNEAEKYPKCLRPEKKCEASR